MLRRLPWAVLPLAAWPLGCGTPPRVHTSSEERAAASLREVRESLPEKIRPAFDEAVRTIALDRLGEDAIDEMASGPEGFDARALAPLNGMTALEVLTEARRIVADRENTQRQKGLEESRRAPP